jgi:methylated-DNA-protein-cysteine methyltransferase-like protein
MARGHSSGDRIDDRTADERAAGLTLFEASVARVLRATEPGDVLAYGEVAAEAGYPGAARAVGNVLKRVDGLPWWRVVTSTGRLIPHHPAEQAKRLTAEGVACADGRVIIDG